MWCDVICDDVNYHYMWPNMSVQGAENSSKKMHGNLLYHDGIFFLLKRHYVELRHSQTTWYINGRVQDCSIPIANALELLQACTKPSIYVCLNTTRLTLVLFWYILYRMPEFWPSIPQPLGYAIHNAKLPPAKPTMLKTGSQNSVRIFDILCVLSVSGAVPNKRIL